jgi:SAM-dependent methyltransferase
MKKSVRRFVKQQVDRLAAAGDCLEIGSYDVNGNLRQILAHTNYTGLDMRQGPNVDVVANSNDLPFPDNFFDVVVCVETFEHDKFFWRTTAQIRRVLRPGGVVILTAPSIDFGIHEYPSDYWRFTEAGLTSLIEDWCGDIESSYHDRAAFVAGRKL